KEGRATIRTTADGGRTWTVTYRPRFPVDSLATAGTRKAWAVVVNPGCRPDGACFPKERLLASHDGGRTWNVRLVHHILGVTFANAVDGLALTHQAGVDCCPLPHLIATADGGRSWKRQRN